MRLINILLIFLLGLFIAGSCMAEVTYPPTNYAISGSYLKVGNSKLWVEKYGHGAPAIILLNGGGDTIRQWNAIIPALAKFTTVIGYDRAGLGKSPANKILKPLTAQTVSLQILTIMQKLNIKSPVILVAHSIGGLYLSYFARKYPDKVAGIVILDGNNVRQIYWSRLNLKKAPKTNLAHLKFMQQYNYQKQLKMRYQISQLISLKHRTEQQQLDLIHFLEVTGKPKSADQILALGPLPKVPAIAFSQNSTTNLYVWHNTIRQFIEEIPCGFFYIIPHSSHYIMIDQPLATIAGIKSVYEAIKQHHHCINKKVLSHRLRRTFHRSH
ncbi:MAG: alpha/beta hydrolase [Gammaproteobacteria bacterium]|nr:alpha/beta hydrolase [Gammaproteobacteria bacterium]